MAQLIVRNLDDDVRDRLRALAAAHGRSMEEEVREILREAALRATSDASTAVALGTRLARRFQLHSLDSQIEELRGQPAKSAELEP